MEQVFVITESPALERSLERYFRYIRGMDVTSRPRPQLSSASPTGSEADRWALRAFKDIASWLESVGGDGKDEASLRRVIVIVDLADSDLDSLTDLNPLAKRTGEGRAWSTTVSMLMLAFPEIHWIFVTPYEAPGDLHFKQAHLLNASNPISRCLNLHDAGYTPLFDPTARRRSIREQMRQIDQGTAAGHVPSRPKEAASIDDEVDYSHFNAYAAYRSGYRGWAVSSWTAMEWLFGVDARGGSAGGSKSTSIELLLEDLYCRFPDRPPRLSMSEEGNSLSNLKERDEELPGLKEQEDLKRRVIVTVGHQRHDRSQRRRNKRHLLEEWVDETGSTAEKRVAGMIQKPFGGIFDLWRKAGMWEGGLWSWNGRPGTAEGFQWPPESSQNSEQGNGGHSAPGRLLAIAERLVDRSKAVLEEARSVPDATYAATLALEAKELLVNRTPTTALEALALQHRAEVVAESMFHGVEFHLDVESRFRDLKEEIEAIGRWFSGRRRKRVTLNARLAIIEDLAREFSRLDQFEEERKCRAEARRLYFDFWAHKSPWRLPFLPLLRYLSFALRSLPVFLGLVVFWILLFGVGWELLEPTVNVGTAEPDMRYRSFWETLSSSTVYFLTLTPPGSYWGEADRQGLWNLVLISQSIVSLSHLGLLVSHIYLIVSRR